MRLVDRHIGEAVLLEERQGLDTVALAHPGGVPEFHGEPVVG